MNIRKKTSKEGAFEYDLYIEEVLLCDEVYWDEEIKSFGTDDLVDNFNSEILLDLKSNKFHSNLDLNTSALDLGFEIFFLTGISKTDNKVSLNFFAPYYKVNKYEWKVEKFYETIKPILKNEIELEFDISEEFEDLENNYLSITFSFNEPIKSIRELRENSIKRLKSILERTKDKLNQPLWKKEYEKNEHLFTSEILLPTLKKMGFSEVKYTHGTKEFGKDIIFSKINEFNRIEYYALQAKAGNVKGSVSGQVNEIIQQIDDAFRIPFTLIGVSNEIYITKVIIAISGKYTENAEIKIRHKVDKPILGNLIFLDKEQILNLN